MALLITVAPVNSFRLSKSPMWYTIQTDSVLDAKLRLNAEIQRRESTADSFATIATLQLTYSPDNLATIFDISQIVDDSFELPKITAFNAIFDPKITANFRVKIYETMVGDPTPLATEIYSDEFFAILGRQDFLRSSEASAYSFATFFASKFLSYMPRRRKIAKGQAMSFSFANLLDGNPHSYEIEFTIKFSDGTTDYLVLDIGSLSFGAARTILFDEEYFISLYPTPEDFITKITANLNLVDTTPVLLDQFVFDVIELPHGRSRHILWLNSVGGLDFLTCKGILKQSLKTEPQIFEKGIALNDFGSQDTTRTFLQSIPQMSFSANTGLCQKGEIEAFISIFGTLQAFYFQKNEVETLDFWFVPIVATASGVVREDDDFLFALDFDFVPLFQSHMPLLLS